MKQIYMISHSIPTEFEMCVHLITFLNKILGLNYIK